MLHNKRTTLTLLVLVIVFVVSMTDTFGNELIKGIGTIAAEFGNTGSRIKVFSTSTSRLVEAELAKILEKYQKYPETWIPTAITDLRTLNLYDAWNRPKSLIGRNVKQSRGGTAIFFSEDSIDSPLASLGLEYLIAIARQDSSTLRCNKLPNDWDFWDLYTRIAYLLSNRDLVEAIRDQKVIRNQKVLHAHEDQPSKDSISTPFLLPHLTPLGIKLTAAAATADMPSSSPLVDENFVTKKELDGLITTLDVEIATLATKLKNIEYTFATLTTKGEFKKIEQTISDTLANHKESNRVEFERIGKDVVELRQTITTLKEEELEDIKQTLKTAATKAEIGNLEQTIMSTQSTTNDIDARLNQTNSRLSTISDTMNANNDTIDAKFKTVDSRFNRLDKRISSTGFWMKLYGGVITVAIILDLALH